MDSNKKFEFQILFRIAQISALVMLLLIPVQIAVYVIAPPPGTVIGLFELYHTNPLLGLLSLDFLYLFNNLIIIVIDLALFVLLYRQQLVPVLLALVIGLIGIACYYPSNPAFEMLTLSGKFFQAEAAQQDIFLAAGEALMAGYTGTTFDVYYVMSTISLLLFSYALIKNPELKKRIGLLGLAAGFFMIIPSSAGTLGLVFSLLSLIPWVVFIAMLMIQFKKLANPPLS